MRNTFRCIKDPNLVNLEKKSNIIFINILK